MFLRRCERRKSGKRHTYGALVESYRTAQGSRQRVVAYLGDLSPSEQDGWAKLGAHLQGDEATRRPERSLFDPPCARDASEEEPVKIRHKDIRLERLRDFGDVWLAWGCGGCLASMGYLRSFCLRAARTGPGARWRRFSGSLGSVSLRVNCISSRSGIAARRWKISWACLPRRCTPIDSTPRSTGFCPTGRRSNRTSSSGSANSSS